MHKHLYTLALLLGFSGILFGAGKQSNWQTNIQPNAFLVKIIVSQIRLVVHQLACLAVCLLQMELLKTQLYPKGLPKISNL